MMRSFLALTAPVPLGHDDAAEDERGGTAEACDDTVVARGPRTAPATAGRLRHPARRDDRMMPAP
jgi:hypothetical protein